jgi:hypothetical protein
MSQTLRTNEPKKKKRRRKDGIEEKAAPVISLSQLSFFSSLSPSFGC